MLNTLMAAASLAALPTPEACQAGALEPEVAMAQALGLQGYVYGYPIVDMLKQRHNETHRVRADQPAAAPVNRIAVYPGVLTPQTQGQLRSANADTLYLNAWVDLSKGPVLLEVPDMGARYYTLAFMDLYAKPHHLGTRTNGGKATRYALVGPSGGTVPQGYEAFRLPTDTAWMLGRIMVTSKQDEPAARRLALSIAMRGEPGPDVTAAEPSRPFDSLEFFSVFNAALKTLPARQEEQALMAQFDAAGFGPARTFDPDKLTPGQAKGLGCAMLIGPQLVAQKGFRPTRSANGWLSSSAVGDPGFDYMLRAGIVRGGYISDPAESIYPVAITDSTGAMLNSAHQYRIRFAKGGLPPVGAFWSITAYDMKSLLTENPIHRYAIGDRTKGLRYGKDGSLEIVMSVTRPRSGSSNWLPVPSGPFHLVTRLYLPRSEALDGRYTLPAVERVD